MRPAMKEWKPKLLLHMPDMLAKRGLRHMELRRGFRERTAFDDLGKIFKLTKVQNGAPRPLPKATV